MKDVYQLSAQVPITMNGMRFDQVASELFPDFSRSRLQSWIKDGQLTVDGRIAKPKDKLIGGETLSLDAELEAQGEWEAEDIDLDIVYEDEDLLVINKQAGLVVHPAAGNYTGTLVNALLHHVPDLVNLPRAGIVHRLDKETTGLMVVAKTLEAHTDLVAQLADRTVSREYQAIAVGAMTGGGTVNAPMGRHPIQRKLMAVLSAGGKRAITHYRVIKRYPHHTHIKVNLETGRTHQIRVHMAHIGFPLVGDQTYGNRFKIPKGANPHLIDALKNFPRQALHAARLGLEHPGTGEYVEWTAPLPADFQSLVDALDKGYLHEEDQ
ncbi:MAG: 23S rRNA pseudouridine(1911/1915/1917) synthase RluD [Cellvibrio sp.]|nr:23S rRNA pseudouridine(1911/1915/1917) synthase RluD [Cellvibrio sp.]